ncbi:MAG: ABC transporter ATP-binding protein [Thermodesulfobacteriota bacterium]
MVRAEGLYKSFSSGRGRVEALRGVSFHVETGTNLIVAGKSGSGKTTLLHCVAGLEKPDRGSITCLGVEIHALGRKALSLFQRRNLGFLFQFGNLISYLTVFDNIAFPLVLNGFSGREVSKRIRDLLERMEMGHMEAALPRELSGGETQRVAFARAIAHSPRILLADEPTASLDSKTGRRLIELILEMSRERGCTAVISTHDPEIIDLADARMVLKDGHKEESP